MEHWQRRRCLDLCYNLWLGTCPSTELTEYEIERVIADHLFGWTRCELETMLSHGLSSKNIKHYLGELRPVIAGNSLPEIHNALIAAYPEISGLSLEQYINSNIMLFQKNINSIKFWPGTLELLSSLYDAGVQMLIGSGCHKNFIVRMLDDNKITHYFSHIVTTEDVVRGKPAGDIFTKCLSLSYSPDPFMTYVVGDAVADIKSAQAAGLKCVLVNNENNEYLSKYHNLIDICPNISDLTHFFKRINFI